MDDVIIPKIDKLALYDRKKEKTFSVDLFISGAVGLKILRKLEVLDRIINNRAEDSDVDEMFEVFELILKRQYAFMDKQWCEDNLDMTATMAITLAIAEHVFEYLKLTGTPVTPEEKKPEAEGALNGNLIS